MFSDSSLVAPVEVCDSQHKHYWRLHQTHRLASVALELAVVAGILVDSQLRWRRRCRPDPSQSTAFLRLCSLLDRVVSNHCSHGTWSFRCYICGKCTWFRLDHWKHFWPIWLGLDARPKCCFGALWPAIAFVAKRFDAVSVDSWRLDVRNYPCEVDYRPLSVF